ncbi:hypothetical protein [Campylobacter concisus]|uniref:hypothetical protein n=1 Tax=Campylobacter concisus TaxID=199 RepID=UPI00122CE306|nr:hypothetical protein [Campylobacter concisus]
MDKIKVLEKGHELEYSFDNLLSYHGVGYPGGVAHAFQVMSRAFPLLDDGKLLERREIYLITAFPGPGGLDAFEMVTRCVTGGRISVDINLKEAEEVLESPHGRYYFKFKYRDKTVVITIKPGFVLKEFIELSRKEDRSEEEEATLIQMKKDMAARLLAAKPEEVYNAKVL